MHSHHTTRAIGSLTLLLCTFFTYSQTAVTRYGTAVGNSGHSSYFGYNAGEGIHTTTSLYNSFFGAFAGEKGISTAHYNSFFGYAARVAWACIPLTALFVPGCFK